MSCYKENEHNKILLLFSCPGQEEEKATKPCAGKTGNNLLQLLEKLNKLRAVEFPKEREKYYINNAFDGIKFKSKTNSTEANKNELLNPENINRLIQEVSHVEKIICFGENARIAISNIRNSFTKKNISVYYSPHLSFRCINCLIKTDIDNNLLIKGQPDNTDKRLNVIARQLLESKEIINPD
ncbi:MAG TPA: hypothetical protein PK514_05940 [Spirochaetota bacterium]|nr:hypothetical protein [Spirochaetota bacterium]